MGSEQQGMTGISRAANPKRGQAGGAAAKKIDRICPKHADIGQRPRTKEIKVGDDIELMAVEVINGGVFQIDIVNHSRADESWRVFVSPSDFFGMLGSAMQRNVDEVFERCMRETEGEAAAWSIADDD